MRKLEPSTLVRSLISFAGVRTDFRAWLSFLLGAIMCVLVLSYIEIDQRSSGLLVFDASSTHTGMLKIIFSKDGVLTDPEWVVNFTQDRVSQTSSFPLDAGSYDLIGFKPLVEYDGKVSISKIRIISNAGVHDIGAENFVAVSQLDKISSQNGEIVIAPSQGANDPFGALPNLRELVPKQPFSLKSFLLIASGKFAIITALLMLMYGLTGNLPFARSMQHENRREPSLSHWLGLLAVGLIILYLRNSHSIFFPVLYAEDGIWSADLINRGFLYTLFNAKADYFVFGNILLLELAKLTNAAFFGHNLTYLPHFVSLFSMLFYDSLAVAPIILLRGVLRIEARLLLWLLVLFVPLGDSSYEVLGRLNNIGFSFLFLAFCLLVWRRHSLQNGSRKQIVATDLMLFLCANTNPLCYPLIAVALMADAWLHWRSSNHQGIFVWSKKYLNLFTTRSALSLLTALFLMGIWLLIREKIGGGSLGGKFDISSIPEAIMARTFLYPFIFPFYSHFNNAASGVLLFIAVAVISLLAKGAQQEKTMLASSIIVLLVATVITLTSRPVLTDSLDHYQSSFPDRYFYGLTLFVYLVLVSALSASFKSDNKQWRKIAANFLIGNLIALYIGNCTFMFEFTKSRFEYLPKATFLDEVKNAYIKGGEGESDGMIYKVALHPTPLFAYLPADYVTATALGVQSLPFAFTDHYSKVPMQLTEIKSHYESHYDGKVIRQMPAGRGREDGWFYVTGGMRSWIPDGHWLKSKNLSPTDIIVISHKEFIEIPDSGDPVE